MLVDAVVVIEIVRRPLIEPTRLSSIWIPRKRPGRPLVVARTLLCIPRTWIRRPVVDEVKQRIVRDPSPHRTAAGAPRIWRPRGHAEIGAAIHGVKRGKRRPDQHVAIGSG